jgi:hypothetical protein
MGLGGRNKQLRNATIFIGFEVLEYYAKSPHLQDPKAGFAPAPTAPILSREWCAGVTAEPLCCATPTGARSSVTGATEMETGRGDAPDARCGLAPTGQREASWCVTGVAFAHACYCGYDATIEFWL